MKVFAVDSSTASASVAILNGGKTLFAETTNFGTTHSENLMPLCDKAFKAAGLKPSDIDLFAVCNGPGSYTGLRIGVSVVKGFAYATSKPTVAISTLKTLACGAGMGNIVALLNARRGNYFCGAYKIDSNGITETISPRLAHTEEIYDFFNGDSFTLTGDGAQLFFDNKNPDISIDVKVSKNNLPSAEIAAGLAIEEFREKGGITAEELLPAYIRDVHIGP